MIEFKTYTNVYIFQNEKSTTPVPKSITPTSSGGSTPGSSGIKSLPKAPPLGMFKFNVVLFTIYCYCMQLIFYFILF